MATPMGLNPHPDARWLSVKMLASDRTMRTILEETILSGEEGQIMESGRTACGGVTNMKDPLARFPKAIDLSSCPVELAGTYHTHVTTGQILNPTHSLPDMANIAFGDLDVSIVAGTQTSDVLVAAEDQEAMADTMRNVLGIEANSTEEIVAALDGGTITDYAAARQRMRSAFAPLFFTQTTNYDDLTRRVHRLQSAGGVAARAPQTVGGIEPMYSHYFLGGESPHQRHTPAARGVGGRSAKIRHKTRRAKDGAATTANAISGTVANVAITEVTRQMIRGVL